MPQKLKSKYRSELYASTRTFLILSQIFVCAPIGVHRSQINNSAQRKCHHLLCLHLFWCLLIYITFTVMVYSEYTESNIDLPTVQKPLYFCEYLVYIIHLLLIIIGAYMARQLVGDFMERILDFDCRLQPYGVLPDYKRRLSTFFRLHLSLIVLHLLVTLVIEYFYTDGKMWSFMRSTYVYVLPNMILQISLTQYYALLHMIDERACALNNVLQVQLSSAHSGGELTRREQESIHRMLRTMRSLYSHLDAFTKAVSVAFGPSVVLVYVGSFMNITVNIFLIYKYVDNMNMSEWPWTMYSVIWTCMHIAKMFLILYYNHCIQVQKNTTALLLNDVKGQNDDIDETITRFILQLIINTRSNFVCGVAELNLDFVKSLLIAISTLFIFLLQYDTTYEALTKTYNSGRPTRKN